MGSVDGLGWNGVMTPPLFLSFYVDAVGGFWLEWGYFPRQTVVRLCAR